MKAFFAGTGVLCGILALGWVFQGNDFFMYKVFAPKYEAARRQVWEETPSYNQGMKQELENFRFQYEQASPESKAALASIILHRAAAYGEEKLSPDMQDFVRKLRAGNVANNFGK
jgi:hypothetical protein